MTGAPRRPDDRIVNPLAELELLLRPAGGGVFLVSTGREEQLALQKKLYFAPDEESVKTAFRRNLARISTARAVVLGVPSDVGAGYRRGANLGPQGIRTELLRVLPTFPAIAAEHGIVDIGDVFVVPQLLEDDMLSQAQLADARAALYPGSSEALPVSPLSITERVLDLVFALNPNVVPFVLGGDHSVAWPVTKALHACNPDLAIVQFDAHTDLLQSRLGIRHCFATWSFHANDLIGRQGRMVQIGIRATQRDQAHWEGTTGVRQFWARECLESPEAALAAILAHVDAIGAKRIYLSNDIDGTDAAFADATGTPEASGLSPEFVLSVIRGLGSRIVAADIMEVAPVLAADPAITLRTAVRYLVAQMEGALGVSTGFAET